MIRKIYLSFVIFAIATMAWAQTPTSDDIRRTSEIYAIKGQDTLQLSRYELLPLQSGNMGEKPCIIFVFGGGFVNGSRDRADYLPYFEHFARKGYTIVSIDYRLGLKKAIAAQTIAAKAAKATGTKLPKMGGKDFLNGFAGIVDMASEDLLDATNYILSHAEEWKIDKDLIVACGSSAGAISVLNGEYHICNETELAKRLPEGFNYAGIVSFAGAIFSVDGDLKWKNKPAPIQFFHGDADMNVPYDQLRIRILGIPLKYGFFGSKHIAKQLDKMDSPYYFYSVTNANHAIADTPMKENWGEIETFLNKLVKGKQKLRIVTNVQQIDKPDVQKNFGVKDFLKANGLGGDKK